MPVASGPTAPKDTRHIRSDSDASEATVTRHVAATYPIVHRSCKRGTNPASWIPPASRHVFM